MSSLLRTVLLGCTLLGTAHAVPLNPLPPFVPLYSSNHAGINDNFYTIDPQHHQLAIQTHGYVDTGPVAFLERRQQPNTKAFKRFYKGTPQTDHFYTSSDSEEALVLSLGWVFERVEGYIYTTQVPGSKPLYRLNLFNGQSGDLVHKYTLDVNEMQQLQAQGWGYDGVAGYVYASGFPPATGDWLMGLRCPSTQPGQCWNGNAPANYRDFYFPLRLLAATFKPAGRTRQQMRFDFWTPDYFPVASLPGDIGAGGHLFFGLHGRFNVGTPHVDQICGPGVTQPSCTWHRGLGTIVHGAPAGQVQAEAWWSMGNSVLSPTIVAGTLQNNRNYQVTITVSDSAQLNYSIVDKQTQQLMISGSWSAQSVYPAFSPFPNLLTGYFLGHSHSASRDFTVYVTGMSVSWLP